MRHLLASAALLALSPIALASPLAAQDGAAMTDETAKQDLTFERVFASPSLNGPSPRGAKLSPDGRYLTLLRNRGGMVFERGEFPVITGASGVYALDLDGDGAMDLVVLRVGPNLTLKGDGACGFAVYDFGVTPGDAWTTAFSAIWEAGRTRPTLAFGNYVDRQDPDGPFQACDDNLLLRPEAEGYAETILTPGFCALSILFSDVDRDGAADLLVGNDFEIPDYLYMGDGTGGLRQITHADARLPHTTTTTMAIKVADLMNDGMPELYFAQIAGRSSGVSKKLKMQDLALYCDSIRNPEARATCARNMEIKTWYRSGNNFDPTYAGKCAELSGALQAECKAMLVKDLAIQRNDPKICALIPDSQPRPRSFCDLHFLPVRAVTAELGNEKIDIVDYSDDLATFVASALSPAKVTSA